MTRIIKKILKGINRVLGTLLGGILYLTKFLIVQAVIFPFVVAASLLGLIALLFSAIPLWLLRHPDRRRLTFTMILPTLMSHDFMGGIFIYAALAVYEGTVDGYKKGLTFTLRKAIVRFSKFTHHITETITRESHRQEEEEREARERHSTTGTRARRRMMPTGQSTSVRQPIQIPEAPQPTNPPTLLTQTEIDQASCLPALTNQWERYKLLSNRHIAPDSDNPDNIQDNELIPGMTVPRDNAVLLVKEVNDGDGEWRVTPIGSYLSGRDDFTTFWRTTPNEWHPLTRDNLRHPTPFENRPTRYSLVQYLGPQSDKELHQLTITIRKELLAVSQLKDLASDSARAATASTATPNPVSPELLRFFRAELMDRATIGRAERTAYSALQPGI